MKKTLLILILAMGYAQAYVINKGYVFQNTIDEIKSQKSILPSYYIFNTQNISAQKNLYKSLSEKADQVLKNRGYFLRIHSPYRISDSPVHQRADDDIFPFVYKRGGLFYLNEEVGFSTEYGFCSGFAHGLRKFDYLAFYKPDLPIESTASYLKKIDRIFKNIPTVFHGVKNLASLMTLNDEIEFYVRKHLVDQWAIQNARDSVIKIYGHHYFELRYDLGEEHFTKLYYQLKRFLDHGFQPLVFDFWGSGINIHALRILKVSNYDPINKKFDIVTYDYTSELKFKTLTIAKARWYQVLPSEEFEMLDYGLNLEKYCFENSGDCLKKSIKTSH